MRYFATASGPKVRDAMRHGLIGHLTTPASQNLVEDGVDWAADNAVFADRYPGDEAFLAWLAGLPTGGCRFVVAPDVVGDAVATLARSVPMLSRIRDRGFPVAFVAQDGLEYLGGGVPWGSFDVLFIGGTTEWKLGPAVRGLVVEAKEQGKWVHMGRVNSAERLRYADAIGCDSVDGTYLAYGPDTNLPKLLGWLRSVNNQMTLFPAVNP